MEKSPIDQSIWECDYQIINRQIELEILDITLGDQRTKLANADDKKLINQLNEEVMKTNEIIAGYKKEIGYFEQKRALLSERKHKDKIRNI